MKLLQRKLEFGSRNFVSLIPGAFLGVWKKSLRSKKLRLLEEGLRAPEALVSNGDDLTIRKLIRFLEGRGRGSGLHLLLKVKDDGGESFSLTPRTISRSAVVVKE